MKAFTVRHHYSDRYPAARRRFGIFTKAGELVGVAVFSQPVHNAVTTSCLPGEPIESMELGRFVLVNEVPGDGESWFIGQCFHELKREGFVGVVSFSDPQPRDTADGLPVFGDHVGGIYAATNGIYIGRGTARTLHLLPNGQVLNERGIQKVRKLERNHEITERQLVEAGARPRGDGAPRAWLRTWVPKLSTSGDSSAACVERCRGS